MEVSDFKIWYDGFTAGKSQLGQEDMEILRGKIMELNPNPFVAPLYPWPVYPSYPTYEPFRISDTAETYRIDWDKPWKQ